MKINFTSSFISFGIALMISFGFYHYTIGNKLILGIGSFMELTIILNALLAIKFDSTSKTINIRTLSVVIFTFVIIESMLFVLFPLSEITYIISNGILLLIYILILSKLNNSKTSN